MFAGAKHSMNAVEAVDGRATGSRVALVAGVRRVAEVIATRALQQVAAGRGHITKLRRGTGQQRLGKHGVLLLNGGVVSQIAVADHGPDPEPACRHFFDFVERERVDVDQRSGPLYVEFHQVDQRGAAGYEFRMGR